MGNPRQNTFNKNAAVFRRPKQAAAHTVDDMCYFNGRFGAAPTSFIYAIGLNQQQGPYETSSIKLHELHITSEHQNGAHSKQKRSVSSVTKDCTKAITVGPKFTKAASTSTSQQSLSNSNDQRAAKKLVWEKRVRTGINVVQKVRKNKSNCGEIPFVLLVNADRGRIRREQRPTGVHSARVQKSTWNQRCSQKLEFLGMLGFCQFLFEKRINKKCLQQMGKQRSSLRKIC